MLKDYVDYFRRAESPEDLKARWRKMAKLTHPDTKGGSAEQFALCKEAYDQVKAEGKFTECQSCKGLGCREIIKGFYVLKETCKFCNGKGKR